MRQLKMTLHIFAGIFLAGVFLTGCQGGFETRSITGQNDSLDNPGFHGAEIDFKMKQAQVAALDAETAMAEATQAVTELIGSNESVLFSTSLTTQVQPQFDSSKWSDFLNRILEKISEVQAKVDEARVKLETALSLINAAAPGSQDKIESILSMLDKLDSIEERIREGLNFLVGKLDTILNKIDEQLAKLDPSKLSHVALIIAGELLKSHLVEFRNQLAQAI